MEDIILKVGNNGEKILPVPYPAAPTPSVPSGTNYGSAPYPMPLESTPRPDDSTQYCNFIEPSPRDQRLNVPYEGNKYCPEFKAQPYGRDSCYLLDSKAQGVTGIVCNQPGGSDNANFERGNQFGVDYPIDFNERMNRKKLEYTVENPVQIPLEMQNPMVIYDKNTFYPEPSFYLRKNKDFITYPLQPNYTEDGLATYNYPYKTLNPIFNDPTQDKDDGLLKVKENFMNEDADGNRKKHIFFVLLVLILIFSAWFFMK